MTRRTKRREVRQCAILGWVLLAGNAPTQAFDWPFIRRDPWPHSSTLPVRTLSHPTLAEHLAADPWEPHEDLRFVAFGDQRALADGEWQMLMRQIVRFHETQQSIAFIVDTGDIVGAGDHADQYAMLHEILAPARALPYLVGVGNHELKNNRGPVARRYAATLLAYLDPDFSAERMYYRKAVGPWCFLFLNSNDLIYGDDGTEEPADHPVRGSRAEKQMAWFVAELDAAKSKPCVVVLHHPLVQSSRKHRSKAIAHWEYTYQGRTLPEMLIDAGVELVLTGHTHTYERFIVARNDGGHFHMVNISGRPRNDVLWVGAGQRRARDIAGEETAWLMRHGWPDLTGWEIIQADVMTAPHEANQFALFTLGWDGGLEMEVHYLDEHAPQGLRGGGSVLLR